eukprot:m51a1_g8391 hypothetical protein (311) ;mRNA; f:210404-211717
MFNTPHSSQLGVLLILIAVAGLLSVAAAQECACPDCETASIDVGAMNKLVWATCRNHTSRVNMTRLRIVTTDQDSLMPSTIDVQVGYWLGTQWRYYTDLKSVKCYYLAAITGDTYKMEVRVKCNNWYQPCPLKWSAFASCVRETSTWKSTCSQCSAQCQRTCTSECTNSRGVTVDDEMCTDPKPAEKTVECITCVDGNSNVVAESNCQATSKPDTVQKCSGDSCPAFRWRVSEWSECQLNCRRSRTVWCQESSTGLSVDDSSCPLDEPAATEECSGGQCTDTKDTQSLSSLPSLTMALALAGVLCSAALR